MSVQTTPRTSAPTIPTPRTGGSEPPMRVVAPRPRAPRVLGGMGVAAGFLFAGMTVWQHAAGFDGTWSSGVARNINAGGFALAMAGYVALAVGLVMARPGGSGRIAPVFPALIGLAWTAFLVSSGLDLAGWGSSSADVIDPVGGAVQGVGLVGLGIATVTAQRWSGWRRWMPLGLAAVFVGALFVPAIIGFEPAPVTEAVWALGYAGLGVALVTESSRSRSSRRGSAYLAGAGIVVLAVATVVTVTGPFSPATHPARAVHNTVNPIGPTLGSANLLEHRSQIAKADASANAAEHRAALENRSQAGRVAPQPSGTVVTTGPIGSADSVPSRPAGAGADGSANTLEHRSQHPSVDGSSANLLEHNAH